eukprot:836961_1
MGVNTVIQIYTSYIDMTSFTHNEADIECISSMRMHASMTFQIEVKGNKIVPFQRRHSVSIPLQYKQYTKHNERAPSLPIKSKSNSPKTSKKQNLPKPKPKQSQYPQSDPPITSIA